MIKYHALGRFYGKYMNVVIHADSPEDARQTFLAYYGMHLDFLVEIPNGSEPVVYHMPSATLVQERKFGE